jgi:hypothetical protein
MTVPKILEDTPHCVEWMVSLEADELEYAYFSSLKAAQTFAEDKVAQKFTVWVAEIGDYLNRNGNQVRSWMYYWWDESTGWGELYGRGKGYRSERARTVDDYTPLDKTDWKG